MAVEAGHAEALLADLAVLGLLELHLWERREQQAQPFELHRREDADPRRVVAPDGEQLAARDVAEPGRVVRKVGAGNSGVG
jgi:hypothetical protein